ncbi:twin-arginine translocase TatA/TatE family subunit [Desulfoprunum benzoelyticum]|uniref:Sec-independent protein translocase protein TatB n=1 Tax=Desulfoprunum benzoelyticum TaxID=1506996 RepID=A0A840UTN2_9BACT|nr:twin-arginine translocase TatA/TatE family subunit [Desulfoprunum benzoelyticum]MBB5346744.1 sec-independent protein translocase protein TatB [Desulfoprunum benzoelyticum]MBM9529014.1 twin-arginine translocase TatA/TatE family subunit [Desulfoprunum benzoelyticum]
MFGIGLPEMILILALALIVVGPDKLPDLARSVAKGLLELKKTVEGLKQSFKEEGNPLNEIRSDLDDAARSLKTGLLEHPQSGWDQDTPFPGVNPPASPPPSTQQPAVDAEYSEAPDDTAAEPAPALEPGSARPDQTPAAPADDHGRQ